MKTQEKVLREIILDLINLYRISLEEVLDKPKKADELLPAILKALDKTTYELKGKVRFDVEGDEDNKDLILYVIDKIDKRYKAIIKKVFSDL